MRTVTRYKQTADRRWQHIDVAEKALGHPLPPGAEVHHVNEIKSDNRGCNLVICPSSSYHALLHQRTRAYDACGHADWRKCCYCKQYDEPKNLAHADKASPRHSKCQSAYNLARYHANREEINAKRSKQKRMQQL